MVQKESRIVVGDNSDARVVLCIHPNKKKNHYKGTSLGNFIKVTIKKRVTRRKNIKRRINWCLVGSTRRVIRRNSGETLRFAKSKVTLVDEKRRKVLGTLIKGVLPREVRISGAAEIISRTKRLV